MSDRLVSLMSGEPQPVPPYKKMDPEVAKFCDDLLRYLRRLVAHLTDNNVGQVVVDTGLAGIDIYQGTTKIRDRATRLTLAPNVLLGMSDDGVGVTLGITPASVTNRVLKTVNGEVLWSVDETGTATNTIDLYNNGTLVGSVNGIDIRPPLAGMVSDGVGIVYVMNGSPGQVIKTNASYQVGWGADEVATGGTGSMAIKLNGGLLLSSATALDIRGPILSGTVNGTEVQLNIPPASNGQVVKTVGGYTVWAMDETGAAGSGVAVKVGGTTIATAATFLNFGTNGLFTASPNGTGVDIYLQAGTDGYAWKTTAGNPGWAPDVSGTGGTSGISVYRNGILVGSGVTALDFVGSVLSATAGTGKVDIGIAGGAEGQVVKMVSGSATWGTDLFGTTGEAGVDVLVDGTLVKASATSINFTTSPLFTATASGAGVTVALQKGSTGDVWRSGSTTAEWDSVSEGMTVYYGDSVTPVVTNATSLRFNGNGFTNIFEVADSGGQAVLGFKLASTDGYVIKRVGATTTYSVDATGSGGTSGINVLVNGSLVKSGVTSIDLQTSPLFTATSGTGDSILLTLLNGSNGYVWRSGSSAPSWQTVNEGVSVYYGSDTSPVVSKASSIRFNGNGFTNIFNVTSNSGQAVVGFKLPTTDGYVVKRVGTTIDYSSDIVGTTGTTGIDVYSGGVLVKSGATSIDFDLDALASVAVDGVGAKVSVTPGGEGQVLKVVSGAAAWGEDLYGVGGTSGVDITVNGTLVKAGATAIDFQLGSFATAEALGDGARVYLTPGTEGYVPKVVGGVVGWAPDLKGIDGITIKNNGATVVSGATSLDFRLGVLAAANASSQVALTLGTEGQIPKVVSGALAWAADLQGTAGTSGVEIRVNGSVVKTGATYIDFRVGQLMTAAIDGMGVKVVPQITTDTKVPYISSGNYVVDDLKLV